MLQQLDRDQYLQQSRKDVSGIINNLECCILGEFQSMVTH